jgi:hypothetical protein
VASSTNNKHCLPTSIIIHNNIIHNNITNGHHHRPTPTPMDHQHTNKADSDMVMPRY